MNNKLDIEQLNDYLDGELSPEAAQDLEARLAQDEAAQVELESLRALRSAAQGLPEEIAPDRDLWGAIETAISEEEAQGATGIAGRLKQFFYSPVGLAAAAVLLVIPSTHLFHALQQSNPPAQLSPAMTTLSNDFVAATAVYQQAREEILAPLREEESALSGPTLLVVEANLARIDEALVELESALLESPENPRLINLLIATREKERSLLERMGRISRSS